PAPPRTSTSAPSAGPTRPRPMTATTSGRTARRCPRGAPDEPHPDGGAGVPDRGRPVRHEPPVQVPVPAPPRRLHLELGAPLPRPPGTGRAQPSPRPPGRHAADGLVLRRRERLRLRCPP